MLILCRSHAWIDRAMVPGASPLLCGKVSRDIKQELDKLTGELRTKKLRWFSECFSVSESLCIHFPYNVRTHVNVF